MKLSRKKDSSKVEQITKRRPTFRSGLSSLFHLIINAALPPVLLILVLNDLVIVALAILLISKWRTIAVTPRYWLANIKANAVDIIVGVATLSFIYDANQAAVAGDSKFVLVQVAWTIWYGIWLIIVKPRSGEVMMGVQAGSGLLLGLGSIFLFADRIPEYLLVVFAWFIASSSIRHFLSSYEEPYIGAISSIGGLMVAQLAWLSNRWLIVYEVADVVRIPQIVLIVALIGYTFAELYHLTRHERLTSSRRNQIVGFGALILVVVVVLSDWSGVV